MNKDSMSNLWDGLQQKMRSKISELNYSKWFSFVRPIKEDDGQLVLGVPDKFFKDWIQEYYLDLLSKELADIAGVDWSVSIEIDPSLAKDIDNAMLTEISTSSQPVSTAPVDSLPATGLNPRYSFDRFVVGSGNQFAHAAARAVADLPGGHYNPLFIYGGVGLGKTHLVSAIGLDALKKYPQMRIVYVTAESFMNEVIFGIRYDKMVELRRKYRTSCDVLLMDDIQFLGGKERTQEEFFHTFNTLFDSHKQIVVTSDRFPKDIPDIEDRLRSRFEWGLIADIQPPDLETRIAILRKKAEVSNITLPNDVVMYLASRIRSNIRELEGALIRLSAYASLSNISIDVPFAERILAHVVQDRGSVCSIDAVQKMVSDFYKLKPADLKSPRRQKSLVGPRQVAMYLCKKFIQASFPEIGDKFGGKDHTTVMHACRKIEEEIKTNPRLKDDVNALENMLKTRLVD